MNYVSDEKVKISCTMWNSVTEDGCYIFPELDYELSDRVYDTNGVGLAISGGGSIAYSAAIGYLRALNKLYIKNKSLYDSTQYISSISGGTWFAGTYLFASEKFDSKLLLGQYIEPSNISTKLLNEVNFTNSNNENLFLGARALDFFLTKKMIDFIKNGGPLDKAWTDAISEQFLKPYGIKGKYVSLNKKQSEKVFNKNKIQTIIPKSNSPFFLCNGSLFYEPLISNGITGTTFTPLYSGLPQLLGKNTDSTLIGGIYTETVGFNSTWPVYIKNNLAYLFIATSFVIVEIINELSNNNNLNGLLLKDNNEFYNFNGNGDFKKGSETLVVIDKSKLITLDDMIGSSSSSITGLLYSISDEVGLSKYGLLDDFNPRYNVLCSKLQKQSKISMFGDGAFSNNLAIIPLVARNVKKIICFNTDFNYDYKDLDDKYSDSVYKINDQNISEDDKTFYTSYLLPLFGKSNIPNKLPSNSNQNARQIFPSESWEQFKTQLLINKRKGGATYARSKLKVLQNKQYGVKGNYYVDLCVILLQPSTIYNSLIPKEISQTFSDLSGPFPNFPNYPLLYTNKAEVINLTKEQINLLHCYTEWCITNTELKDVIIDMYRNC
jgi:hypothetical protein